MDIQKILSEIGGGQALQDMAAKAGVSPQDAQNILGGALQHTADGGGIEGMVASVAGKAGVDPGLVQQLLPQLLPLLQGHPEGAPGGALGGIMGSLGGLLGGASTAGGASPAGGLLGLAQSLFGKKD